MDPKLRTASESHLKHFGEKVASLCDTCTGKTLHLRFKVRDEHDSILPVGRFTEVHDDRAAWLTNKNAFLRFESGHDMKLMKQNRHWILKMFIRAFMSTSVCVERQVFDACLWSDGCCSRGSWWINVTR